MTWQSRTWAGFDWSSWVPLEDVSGSALPSVGLYRIRSLSPSRLVYVGQGKLKERVRYWAQATRKSSENVPQSSRPKLWFLTFHRERLGGYEVSWTQGPIDVSGQRWRKGHEKRLFWRYRREKRRSSLANHGRTGAYLQLVGAKRQVGSENFSPASMPPLESEGRPAYSIMWMGRNWTNFTTRQELKHASRKDLKGYRLRWMQKGVALYKALGPRLQLRKVGHMRSARYGLLRVFRNLPDDTVAAWSNLGWCVPRYQCRELTSDLVGAHLQRTGRLPDCQF